MNYRKATFKDINSIASLVTNLLGTCNLESNKTILESNIEDVSKSINNYYVCTVNSKVVGACGISNIQKQDTYNLKLKNVKEILYLVVDKKYQGNGIGTRLLNLCSHNCKMILFMKHGEIMVNIQIQRLYWKDVDMNFIKI